MVDEPTRRYFTTAQVRAVDVHDDDIFLLDGQWRSIFDVHTDGCRMLEELFAEATATAALADAERVRLDTLQGRNDGSRSVVSATPRPDHKPVILAGDRQAVSVHHKDDRGATGAMRTESVVAALLSTGEYIAIRFVRDETSDGSQTDDGWAIFRRWDLVTVQVETTL